MVGFFNLSRFFNLDLTIDEFWQFFDICHIDGVKLLRTRHRLLDLLRKLDHDCSKDTLDISGKWESDSSLSCVFRQPSLMVSDLFHLWAVLGCIVLLLSYS